VRPIGLRTRVTAGFAIGALALSSAMALLSYQLVRTSLTEERERTAARAAYVNATAVQAGLGGGDPNIVPVLRSLRTTRSGQVLVRRHGTWYARSADEGITSAIPAALQRRVAAGHPSVQRLRVGRRPVVVVGVPVSASTAFYEVDSLATLEGTLSTLALTLTSVAVVIAGAGAVLGWYASRAVLRPLTTVAETAEHIAAGRVRARLDPATEPDLARLAMSFNRMVDELADRVEQDRRFAADVSHELRSPLQTLAGAASVLSRRADRLDERTAAAAALVSDEVQRFGRLVDDLLALARGDQAPDRPPVDVAALAHEVCRAHQVPVDLVRVEGGPVWNVDRQGVAQILNNLVENAVRYGGGPTAIRLSNGEIVVEDRGPGVREEEREVIFGRFVRGRAAHARGTGGGAGLGLAIVAAHAAAHGGAAWAEDSPDGGARFRVRLEAWE
jgi:two-component system sensor histidine kinase MtrB